MQSVTKTQQSLLISRTLDAFLLGERAELPLQLSAVRGRKISRFLQAAGQQAAVGHTLGTQDSELGAAGMILVVHRTSQTEHTISLSFTASISQKIIHPSLPRAYSSSETRNNASHLQNLKSASNPHLLLYFCSEVTPSNA